MIQKIASQNLDFVDYYATGDKILVPLLKEASANLKGEKISSPEAYDSMQDSDFAVILNTEDGARLRKFAKMDKASTYINLKLLEQQKDSLPEDVVKTAATNLVRAAEDYKIPVSEWAQEFKTDSFIDNEVDITKLSYDYDIEESHTHYANPEEQKYPIDTAEQIKQACEYFDHNHRYFSLDGKKAYADNVRDRAEDLNVDIEDTLTFKYANLDRTKVSSYLKDHIQKRIDILKDNSPDEYYTAYSEVLEKAAASDPFETLDMVKQADEMSGNWQYWGKSISDPLLTTFPQSSTEHVKVAGIKVTLEGLRKLGAEELTELVGSDAVGDLHSDEGLAVYETLPTPIKREVANLVDRT